MKYVFIDRDGVINRDGAGRTEHSYVTRWEDFDFLPGVIPGFKALKEAGYKTIIISNQKCVGKGIVTTEELDSLTRKMKDAVEKGGGKVDGVFYCPHLDEDNCDCRKPKTGLLLQAKKMFNIDTFSGKYFIGDSERDIVAGKSVGLKTILVLSGKSSRKDVPGWVVRPDIVAENFELAVKAVLEGS